MVDIPAFENPISSLTFAVSLTVVICWLVLDYEESNDGSKSPVLRGITIQQQRVGSHRTARALVARPVGANTILFGHGVQL